MDIVKVSLKRPVFISMVTLFLVSLGAISIGKLPVDLYPDISYPVLVVRSNLDGAAPEEIEQLITKPMEDSLSTIAGIEKIRSISREGSSIVVLEFSMDEDVRFQEMQVRAKVANIRRSLPEDMSEPVVARQDPDDTPVIEIVVSGDRTAAELTDIADDEVARRLRQLSGVGEVELGGEREREVLVSLDPIALENYKLSPRAVVTAIRDFNRNDPAGKLEGEGRVWVLRSLSQAKSVNDLAAIPVGRLADRRAILLRDVAEVTMGFKERERVSWVGNAKGSRAAISIDVLKQSGRNTVAISDAVKKAVEDMRADLPSDVEIQIVRDNADLIRSNVADVNETLVIGGILTVIVVLFFLGSIRSTFTTGLALPTSIIATFVAMGIAGFTINVMTLLALSLAIGLLVDDAIVVRENIFRHMRQGTPPAEAAYKGTWEVMLAVLATTLTIVAVFLPVGFMGGVSGQFFQQFSITVVFAILVSTWDALTMAPMLSAYYANFADPREEWARFGRAGLAFHRGLERLEHGFDWLAAHYGRFLGWLVPRPWVAALVTALAIGGAYGGFSLVKKSFLPTQLGDVFTVNLNGPLAQPMDPVADVAALAENRFRAIESLDFWTVRAGAGFSGSANVRFTIRIKEEFAKSQDSLAEVRKSVRDAIGEIPGYRLSIREPSDPLAGSAGRFQPVAVMISGIAMDQIRDIATAVEKIMEGIPGIGDLSPLDDAGLPEIRVHTETQLAAYYGVTAQDVSDTLKIWVAGDTTNSLREGDDQIPIRVKLGGGDRMATSSLLAMNINKTSGSSLLQAPVANFVTWQATAGPPVIVREDRQRMVRVGADLERGAGLADVVAKLETELKALPLPAGYSVRVSGQNEQMSELFGNVVFAILIGSIFVYMILASLFESFTQPLTVMTAIPLAATGAMLALVTFDMALDLYAGIGIILLAGIVAKNSILLVDFAIQRVRDEGDDPEAAILASAPLRLRPILMTSVAMIAGMIPVATGWGAGGAARQTLGIATIGGVLSSTVLTLLIVPNVFIFVERITRRLRAAMKRQA